MDADERLAPTEALKTLALHRYWVWADFQKRAMFECGRKIEAAADRIEAEALKLDAQAALSFFYASLYVVIEGWRELRLVDEEINGLIASENTDLLRRFRNGVFHFQPEYDDGRFLGFLDHAGEPVDWAQALHNAFARWFEDWGKETFGFGPRDIAAWMKAERQAAEAVGG